MKAIGDQQASVVDCQGQGDDGLAVVLLAELAAVLPSDADRVGAFLEGADIVDHPAADGASLLDDRQNMGADGGQKHLVGPVSLEDEVMQRLIGRLHLSRLDALAASCSGRAAQ